MWDSLGRDLQRAFWALSVVCFVAGCLGGTLVLLTALWMART